MNWYWWLSAWFALIMVLCHRITQTRLNLLMVLLVALTWPIAAALAILELAFHRRLRNQLVAKAKTQPASSQIDA